MKIYHYIALVFVLTLAHCKPDEEPEIAPEIRFSSDRSGFESAENETFTFTVNLDKAGEETVRVDYETIDVTATADEDYIPVEGSLTFSPGQTSKTIDVTIIVDDFLESDEQFIVKLSNPINSFLKDNLQEATGTIRNDDNTLSITEEGYTSADSYPGMNLVWSDEFNDDGIDLGNWTYDVGANGWGNQELQNYTTSSDNSYTQDGKLVIVAQEISDGVYNSARLKSIGLQEFQYGRIDVRAILPVDDGLWPAIWMLGADFPSDGWPSCGEIDIMELVGSNPRRIHGTVHWGANNSQHQYTGQGVSIPFPETFADEFHVFSIIWEENSIRWLLDDEEYYSIDGNVTGTQAYPFNDEFFFIMNVAVGGEWPGPPSENTTFPEFMAVDYVRVFQ